MHTSRKRRLVGGGMTVVVLVAASLAYAAWTASGTGSGYAEAQSAEDLTTSAATPTATLYPGATGDAELTINNPNPYPVEVDDITGDGAITAAGGTGTCTTTGVTFTDQTGQNIDVPANGSVTEVLVNSVQMSNASDNGCQGATFTIPVALSGVSDAS